MLDPNELKARIEKALPGSTVELRDTTGTGDHFEARVVSSAFIGLSMVQQHQQVYAPLQDVLATGELHALALKTYTPDQWSKVKR
ncbi:MAG: BolA/IbaG family iron-sulfur metabolism protein [Myxococcaceae bacterium]|nr:BolA/IbaG family iron-sulfur metabolism protein [Myxococcaceae bacterium]MCA3013102.1 BolA/IbaG family iron-sulfur metabolism protein [Myxococcaceae bacterium]